MTLNEVPFTSYDDLIETMKISLKSKLDDVEYCEKVEVMKLKSSIEMLEGFIEDIHKIKHTKLRMILG